MIPKRRLRHLICPWHKEPLEFTGDCRGQFIWRGYLACPRGHSSWAIDEGIVKLFDPGAVQGTDRLMRWMYDAFARWHDPALKYLLPIIQNCSEETFRNRYLSRLELERLAKEVPRGPIRILEVGVGTGANIPLVLDRIPETRRVEYWGMDLSSGMLNRCVDRIEKDRLTRVRLLMADAHFLPFRDRVFHRVFHVGGISGFRDKAKALREMLRVSKPDTPIVVVDEQYDPAMGSEWWRKLSFRAVTFFDDNPHAPVEYLPKNAANVIREQIAGFFYCLTFRKSRA